MSLIKGLISVPASYMLISLYLDGGGGEGKRRGSAYTRGTLCVCMDVWHSESSYTQQRVKTSLKA